MVPEAREVRLSPKDRKVLEARCRSPLTLHRDLKRARIVLLAAAGRSTRSIAKEVGVQPWIVSLWRHRFADHGLEGLKDKPRPGKKPIDTKATDRRAGAKVLSDWFNVRQHGTPTRGPLTSISTTASAVVIIGSGAVGGTLANELCQKGINVVLLEAGKHHTRDDFINDEWPAFSQLAWLDKRTTSGSWRIAQDFPNLPAWICKTVGEPRHTGLVPACASRSTSPARALCTARLKEPLCLTGRSRCRSLNRTMPRPRTRWG
jgi:hypothetical protein